MTQPLKYGIIGQGSPFKTLEVTMIKYFLFFGRVKINSLAEVQTLKFQSTIFDFQINISVQFMIIYIL